MILFCEEWETNRISGKRQLNDIRLVKPGGKSEDAEESYYKFRVFCGDEKFIGECDAEDKYLLDTYRWSIPHSRQTVRSSIRNGKKTTVLSIPRLILDNPDGTVVHADGNFLNNRRSNLRIKKVEKDPRLDYVVPGADMEMIKLSLRSDSASDWKTGKIGGSFAFKESHQAWRVVFSSPHLQKLFSIVKYGNKATAKHVAEIFHQKEAESRGLIKNSYRFHMKATGDAFIEIKAVHKDEEMSWYCDAEDINLVKEHTWHLKKDRKTLRVTTNGSKYFHVLLGLYEITDHIDGNPLNNRRSNLRDGTLLNARNYPKRDDNASGVTGVSFNKSKKAWVVQWPEDGKRKCKQFGIFEGQTKTEAKKMAVAFRRSKDESLNLHEQQRM